MVSKRNNIMIRRKVLEVGSMWSSVINFIWYNTRDTSHSMLEMSVDQYVSDSIWIGFGRNVTKSVLMESKVSIENGIYKRDKPDSNILDLAFMKVTL